MVTRRPATCLYRYVLQGMGVPGSACGGGGAGGHAPPTAFTALFPRPPHLGRMRRLPWAVRAACGNGWLVSARSLKTLRRYPREWSDGKPPMGLFAFWWALRPIFVLERRYGVRSDRDLARGVDRPHRTGSGTARVRAGRARIRRG